MKRKISNFRRFITFFTIFGFMFTQMSFAYAQRLSPETFGAMYQLASEGNLHALKSAIARGLNIDSVNNVGNTGVCQAITNYDYRAYNTFYAAGANPKPACVYKINPNTYKKFMSSRFVTPVRSNLTYSAVEYSAGSNLPIILGGAVIAGGAYWAISGDDDDDEIVKTSPCLDVDCGDGATCVESPTSASEYMCICSFGYVVGLVTGKCIEKGNCEGDANCSFMNGVCNVQSNQCVCPDGTEENAAGICQADACLGVDCGSNGNCSIVSNIPACVCSDGYSGEKCDVPPALTECTTNDECTISPNTVCNTSTNLCQNPCSAGVSAVCGAEGVSCSATTSGLRYSCTCSAGSTFNSTSGKCEAVSGYCSSDAQCTTAPNTKCNLSTNKCEDACAINPCGIGGLGSDPCSYDTTSGSVVCSCKAGYVFNNGTCELLPSYCETNGQCLEDESCENVTSTSAGTCQSISTISCGLTTDCTSSLLGEYSVCNTLTNTCQCAENFKVSEGGVCNGCLTDTACDILGLTGTTPRCDLNINKCVQCLSDADCGAGEACDSSGFCKISTISTDTTLISTPFDGSSQKLSVKKVENAGDVVLSDVKGYVEENMVAEITNGKMIGVETLVEGEESIDTNITLANINLDNNTNNKVSLVGVDAVKQTGAAKLNVHLKKDNHIVMSNHSVSNDNEANLVGINANGENVYVQTDGIVMLQGDSNLYGVKAQQGAVAINRGDITVVGDSSYGMYAKDNAMIVNQGNILVDGNNSYGMYADNAKLVNTGSIEMIGQNSVGIKAVNSSDVINTGIITVNGALAPTDCSSVHNCNNFIEIDDTSTFTNSGVLTSDGDLDLSVFAGKTVMIIDEDSQIIAEGEIKGTVMISSSVVLEGQKEEYVLSNAFEADSIENLEVLSQSAFFGVSTLSGSGGVASIALTKNDFATVLDNKNVAKYLEDNYAITHNIYSPILAASSANANQVVNNILGIDIVSNFAQQNMDVIRSVNYNLENAILREQDYDKDENIISGYAYSSFSSDYHPNFASYNDYVSTLYTLMDKKYSQNMRYGIGGAFTRLDSEYSNDSERSENIYQLYGLLSYKAGGYSFLSVPTLGLGVGEYARQTNAGRYDADVLNYYYGVSNTLKRSFEFENGFLIEPLIALNVMGIYQTQTEEKNQLTVDGGNSLSVEAGVGLYFGKDFKFENDDTLRIKAGGTMYYELMSNPYADRNASMSGLGGYYVIDPKREDRDRQAMRTSIVYTHQNFDINTDISKYLNNGVDDGYSFNLTVKYNF